MLDPRLKISYYKANRWGKSYYADAKDALTCMYTKYKIAARVGNNDEHNNHHKVQKEISPIKAHIFKWLLKSIVEISDEVTYYLDSPVTNFMINNDPLLWWKKHQHSFPILSMMAHDYLAIPASSAPVEQVFSRGTDLVSAKCMSLAPESIQVCMCLKGWLQLRNDDGEDTSGIDQDGDRIEE